ncbi:3' terminal RNA ribose 2'-O-methyltransferase Hen1 [Nocardia sp. CDC160]|uniref:3' terminal RNA ribose 2'-O-methyltransferase Hen1 n=1 Tax=Nocardia sp. CDC160 TaxID=3112166 RepID=UPI002DBE852E|nr:3' terminal RNA ribose 2'-O-methyltransferase Hen1 [Nocardia sp. CDC160]MEC3915413.1 3' terminal RNA ribose 2'-O-methyltransferase Hen1 [Nocardia sp. CDC160]
MLLTISCTRPEAAGWPATDLGFLLHKNPSRIQTFEQSYGVAHVFYPEADADRCTAALMLEIDPVRLVRGKSKGTPEFSLGQYVNDRPYAASSLLSVALSTVFGTALHGRCAQRPELAETALPLRIALPAVPCKGGPEYAERVFAPLGWTVVATPVPLDPAFPEWGDSHYVRVELTGTLRLADALSHLYVLLPVLDGSKHYWLDTNEIDKLLRFGEGWLTGHPEREWITRRYLTRRHTLVRTALARLAELDDAEPEELGAVEEDFDDDASDAAAGSEVEATASDTDPAGESEADSPAAEPDSASAATSHAPSEVGPGTADAVSGEERGPSLAVLRRQAVHRVLLEAGASRVLDLGCGQAALLRELAADRAFTEIVGVDVSMRELHIAARRLRRLPEWQSRRVTLRQGALTYTDASLKGYDAAVLMEVIEHVDLPRLKALEHAVFVAAAPGAVVVTTPNSEYNVRYDGLDAGTFRHTDHRFEWSRAEFADWAGRVGETYGYAVRFEPVGPEDPELGPSTQMAVFTKQQNDSDEKGAA